MSRSPLIDRRGLESLREILHYDPETGVWRWRVRKALGIFPGDVAGSLNQDGHRQIMICGKSYLASRLAWLYMTGEWPASEIDHRDPAKPDDDSWQNLRASTHGTNAQNRRRRRDNTSGFKGAFFHRSGAPSPWQAKIGIDGKVISLGYFRSAEEAHAAYCRAGRALHGEFFNPG